MFNQISRYQPINPQNKQGKYLMNMLKNNVQIKDPVFQQKVENKFKSNNFIILNEKPIITKNVNHLFKKYCIYI